jgi:pimeloyl-ACP methyl ester carboxylesterase
VDHDIVFYDQRGVGRSRPSLACPELDQQVLEDAAQGVRGPAEEAHFLAAALRCRDRLLSEGTNPAAYTTAESAADLEDIRVALGYTHLNLFGISYGTYLAQAAMRAFPHSVRSAVLDSVVPAQLGNRSDTVATADHTLRQVFALCGADEACDRAYPGLESTYLGLVGRLSAQPVAVPFGPAPGGVVHIDDSRFGSSVFQQLYGGPGEIPALISAVDRGEYGPLIPLLAEILQRGQRYDLGAMLSASCSGFAELATPEQLTEAAKGLLPGLQRPRPVPITATPALAEICRQWPTGPRDPAERMPVQSDVPALVLAGQFDPVTPPQNGRLVANGLRRGVYVELPGQGHGAASSTPCGRSMIRAFLANPSGSPDTSCTSGLGVRFHLP